MTFMIYTKITQWVSKGGWGDTLKKLSGWGDTLKKLSYCS